MKSYTKGSALALIHGRLSKFVIPKFMLISSDAWIKDPDIHLDSIQEEFNNMNIVVRSSATDEDGKNVSRAGEYKSVLNLESSDRNEVKTAVNTVVNSYEIRGKGSSGQEFIVQEMITNVALSGVIFTHDLNSGAPYYVINYDDVSGLTNTVTSGDGEYANRTLYIHRSATGQLRSERFQRLVCAVKELELLLDNQFLDIEFALDKTLQPYLLQVRAITTQPNWNRSVARRIDAELSGIQTFVRECFQPKYGVFGNNTVLGQMPDWNPAEMIGRAPRALSLSLYRTLITDHSWRRARSSMGYATPSGQSLMVSLAGQPFVDTRLSFHTYLPANLPASIAEKLVDTWVTRLREHPELHDKIEFDVAITTFSFDINEKLDRLVGDVLSANERKQFQTALHRLTLPLIRDEGEGSISSALLRIESLANKSMPPKGSDLTAMLSMIDDCIRLGTEPFAILARHGFIARTLLLSLVTRGVLTSEDVANFQAGVSTVAGELVNDIRLLNSGELARDTFMKQYGHLRPGTYDILSLRYDQMQDFLLSSNAVHIEPSDHRLLFKPTKGQRLAIDNLLRNEGLEGIDCDRLLKYCESAIAGREYGKFVFTRSVSAMLELIAEFGERHGLSRDEMSHLPLNKLLDIALCSTPDASIEEHLRQLAEDNAERHAVTSAIRLPQVLFDEAGVHIIPFQVSHPNFVTMNKINANMVYLNMLQEAPEIKGMIVLIENADPGYDWIFAHGIVGLVTKYGGANSHMAIRCAEFGIPAAIGCGEQRFQALLKARRLSLDCSVGLITQLH